MSKFSAKEVGDSDHILGSSVAPSLGFSSLHQTVKTFDIAIREFGIETFEDACTMLFESVGQLLERFQSAASGPAMP